MHALLLLALVQDPQDEIKKLQEQVLKMQVEFDAKLKAMQREIEKLKLQIPEEAATAPPPPAAPSNPNVFNPSITAVSNFLWRIDDKRVFLDNDPAEDTIDDQINLREFELDMRASIDPYADGVAILALESEVAGDYDVDVEEAYARIKALPVDFLDPMPLGMKAKVGRFRTEFGRNNILHLHDLPQSTRPLVVEEFLGEEGHIANGLGLQMFLPWFEGDTTLELTTQIVQGGDLAVADGRKDYGYLGNLRFFSQIDEENVFDIAAIAHYGVTDDDDRFDATTLSLDVLYKWKPLAQGEYASFVLGGQLFYSAREFVGPTATGHDETPFGWYGFAQYQLDKPWYVGVRYDWTETIDDDDLVRSRIGPYISWYPSEFLRLRLTYEHTWSDLAIEDDLDTMMFEINWVFGAHPPEPFWVNK